MGVLAVSAGVLFFSYNALSHDVFNYLFNARMVLEYGANPHVSVALNFPDDLWTRFMHNTHTPAPYGYGWTAVSLLPGWLGMGSFTLSWLLFRLLGIGSVLLLADVLVRLMKVRKVQRESFWLAVVVLNPLVLIEVISNAHNDLWMMVPALWSLYLLERHRPSKSIKTIKIVLLSAGLLLFSISVKLATLVLLPVWLLLALRSFRRVQSWVELRPALAGRTNTLAYLLARWWPTVAALLLFATFLTARSTYFHPWYLTWVLVFLPFIPSRFLQQMLVFFSISSLFRYIPWLYVGEYTAAVLQNRLALTWLLPVFFWILYYIVRQIPFWQLFKGKKHHE
jgi:hypothetical protein